MTTPFSPTQLSQNPFYVLKGRVVPSQTNSYVVCRQKHERMQFILPGLISIVRHCVPVSPSSCCPDSFVPREEQSPFPSGKMRATTATTATPDVVSSSNHRDARGKVLRLMVKEGMWLLASVTAHYVAVSVNRNLNSTWNTSGDMFAVSDFGEAEKKLLLLIFSEMDIIFCVIFQGVYRTSLHIVYSSTTLSRPIHVSYEYTTALVFRDSVIRQ